MVNINICNINIGMTPNNKDSSHFGMCYYYSSIITTNDKHLTRRIY